MSMVTCIAAMPTLRLAVTNHNVTPTVHPIAALIIYPNATTIHLVAVVYPRSVVSIPLVAVVPLLIVSIPLITMVLPP